MNDLFKKSIPDRIRNIYRFYFIVLGVLVGFLIGEILITEYVLHVSLDFFQRMIPTCILYALLLVITLIYAQKTETSNYEMGFHSLYVPKSLAIGFLATIGYLIVAIAFQMPLNYPSLAHIFIIGCFALLIGITEESIFRGYIQTNYLHEWSQMKAVVFTGILFAFLHIPSYLVSGSYYNIMSVPSLLLVGLILGFIRIHTGNIWGVIIVHMTWNYYMFLFTPVIDFGLPIEELIPALIPALAVSIAMWGSILLAMFVARKWVDRPEQIPGEMAREFSIKINALMDRIWQLQQRISVITISGRFALPQAVVSDKIGIAEGQIKVYKEYLPLIDEKNYKLLQKLVPLKAKLVKIEHQIKASHLPMRTAALEAKKAILEADIQLLEKALTNTNNFKI